MASFKWSQQDIFIWQAAQHSPFNSDIGYPLISISFRPQKYPSVRDFESQSVKRLIYFENAEKETDPSLLVKTNWDVVKDYFVQLAKKIERSWLA